MPEKTRLQKKVDLNPFYQKDLGWLRERVAPFFPKRTMTEWRTMMGEKRGRGERLYYLAMEGSPVGGVNVLSPFGSPTWRLARLHSMIELDHEDLIHVAGQIFEEDEGVYRVDLLYNRLSEEDAKSYGLLTGIDWPDERLTVYAPQARANRTAFIPWSFGFLAVTTTEDQEEVESIDFVREGGENLSLPVLQAAYYQGYIGHDGKLIYPKEKNTDDEGQLLARVRSELSLYLAGGHELSIPYRFPRGTEFQRKVWEETLKIPYGTVKTYADIARILEPDPSKAGRLARAVGGALAANPLPIVIPCHRVIGANRDLTGFGGGVDIKDYLLRIEMWRPAPG